MTAGSRTAQVEPISPFPLKEALVVTKVKTVMSLAGLLLLVGCPTGQEVPEPEPIAERCDPSVTRASCGFTDDTRCPATTPSDRDACESEGLQCSYCIDDDITDEFVCDLGKWIRPEEACLPLP